MTREVSLESLNGPRLVSLGRFFDERGYLQVSWNDAISSQAGADHPFVQDNLVKSGRGVLRGMHYQDPGAQGKLVSALVGRIYDVVVDVRHGSATFGCWAGATLDEETAQAFWVPRGFAHGYQVVSETSLVQYKVDAPYRPEEEVSLSPLDATLAINWPLSDPILSEKDADGVSLTDAPAFQGEK